MLMRFGKDGAKINTPPPPQETLMPENLSRSCPPGNCQVSVGVQPFLMGICQGPRWRKANSIVIDFPLTRFT